MLNERSPTKKHLYKMVYNANQSVMTGQVNGCLGWDGGVHGGCIGDYKEPPETSESYSYVHYLDFGDQPYPYFKTHQLVHFRYVKFIMHQLYLDTFF